MQLSDKQKAEGWRIVKFGDVAEHISKRINPTIEDSARYIGLEHLDSGSIRVSRWGTDIALKGQKLEMKKGDILFAKRNAYLKRVAIAPFDGIFSAHGMVLRPHGNLIMHDFLPFFMQSDMFMERAVAISEGSLSPTIKWKTLARQEFLLPSCARQREMLKLLQRIEDIRIDNDNLQDSIALTKKVIMQNIFKADYANKSLHVLTDIKISPVDKKTIKSELPVKLCNYMDVYSNTKIHNQISFMQATATPAEIANFTLHKGDVVITKDSEDPYDIAVPSFIAEDIEGLVCGYHLVIFQPNLDLIDGRYLFHILNSDWAKHKFYPFAQGITRFGIISTAYEKISIPVPSLEKQVLYADTLDLLNEQFELMCNRGSIYNAIQRKIVNVELH